MGPFKWGMLDLLRSYVFAVTGVQGMRTYYNEPLHAPSMEACRLRIDNLTKPIYSLATLGLIAERFAGILANLNQICDMAYLLASDHW